MLMMEWFVSFSFQIYDPNNKRYEVPLNLTKGPPNHTGSGDYVVTLQQSPFGILIRRSSTGATLCVMGLIPFMIIIQLNVPWRLTTCR